MYILHYTIFHREKSIENIKKTKKDIKNMNYGYKKKGLFLKNKPFPSG